MLLWRDLTKYSATILESSNALTQMTYTCCNFILLQSFFHGFTLFILQAGIIVCRAQQTIAYTSYIIYVNLVCVCSIKLSGPSFANSISILSYRIILRLSKKIRNSVFILAIGSSCKILAATSFLHKPFTQLLI